MKKLDKYLHQSEIERLNSLSSHKLYKEIKEMFKDQLKMTTPKSWLNMELRFKLNKHSVACSKWLFENDICGWEMYRGNLIVILM